MNAIVQTKDLCKDFNGNIAVAICVERFDKRKLHEYRANAL